MSSNEFLICQLDMPTLRVDVVNLHSTLPTPMGCCGSSQQRGFLFVNLESGRSTLVVFLRYTKR